MVQRLNILWRALVGHLYILLFKLRVIPTLPPYSYNPEMPELIVSLTSYGRRIRHTVYYSILSIFFQSHLPNRIVLWIDQDEITEEDLPEKLKKLRKHGLEIRYCPNLRSYKKLVPTLSLYPNSVIVTIDDDVVYSSHLLERLCHAYKLDPSRIYCTEGYFFELSSDGKPKKYNDWVIVNKKNLDGSKSIFPVGVGGVLYPPHSLSSEVAEVDRFTELCPDADDLWFWYMAKLNGTNHSFVPLSPNYYSFDVLYQKFHRGSALNHTNKKESRNDIQLARLIECYGLPVDRM